MNIGVLGGTFDPIHIGHLAVAEEVRVRLSLEEVLFMPAPHPWLKADSPISPAEHRLAMVRLALSGKPYFKLSAMEIERGGPTYTVDTIRELKARLGASAELFFILGWDNLAELPRWRQPARLIRLCCLVAVSRPGYRRPDLKDLEARVPGLSRRVTLLDKPEVDVSASDIRGRVFQGLPISHLVPEPVAEYIKQHRLYLRD